jgi:CRISPR system Cascade subunit CasC
MKIEIHLLQNFAPSCLNRDDTNTPKECEFGGVRRARVSSQSFKRAIREHFRKENAAIVGERTKALKTEILKHLPDADPKTLESVLSNLASVDSKRPDETNVLVFIGQNEIAALVECVKGNITDKKAIEKAIKEARTSVDVALFGRMLAEAPNLNIDASCQVAHAISTHAAQLEMDFFTAVDDLNPREDVGAGMLGYTGYNSACLYRYALLDTVQLAKNLGIKTDDPLLKEAVEAFLRAFVLAEPSAKQNSMAAHNLPSFGLLVSREKGTPVSLANAFCKPVPLRKNDLIGGSVAEFVKYQKRLSNVYGTFEGATMALWHDLENDENLDKNLGDLKSVNEPSLQKSIAKIMGTL